MCKTTVTTYQLFKKVLSAVLDDQPKLPVRVKNTSIRSLLNVSKNAP